VFIYLDSTASQAVPPTFSPINVPGAIPVEWTHMEAVVKVPAGVGFMTPELFFWRAKGSLYVDDFTFQKVDSTTPLTPFAAATTSP
jgi:hypothetical protein